MRLIAEDLAGGRGDVQLFGNLNFTVEPQQALIITGANGIGKSTLLRIIAGLLPSIHGSIRLDDGEGLMRVHHHCHYLGSQNAMKPALSVYENLQFWQNFQGDWQGWYDSSIADTEALSIDAALEVVGLSGIDHFPYAYLSTGQKRRTTIAALLCAYRPVWLLDEPTSGLDLQAQAMFAGLMRNHLQKGGMIIAATHIPLGLEDADNQLINELRMEDYIVTDEDYIDDM